MKLNYYMRGLGIGIVVTALLMGIALSGRKEKITDEEIRQRALDMGMVDGNTLLADLSDNKTLSDNDMADKGNAAEDTPEENLPEENPESENNKETESENPENSKETNNGTPENGKETDNESLENGREGEEETPPKGEEGVIVNEITTINISSGDGSRTVANKLLQAKLIDDAAAYDDFLCRNGYDKRLKTGRHDIPAGASNEEIAAILVQRGY